MSLNLPDLTDLLRRARLSELRGYTIARGDHYAQEMGGTDASPAGLSALCRAAIGEPPSEPSEPAQSSEPAQPTESFGPSEPAQSSEPAREAAPSEDPPKAAPLEDLPRETSVNSTQEPVSDESASVADEYEPVSVEPASVEPVSVDEPTLVGPRASEPPRGDRAERRTEAAESIAEAADSIAGAAESISDAADTIAVTPAHDAEEAEVSDDNAEHYESWSKKKLIAAATEKGVETKYGMTKADIIAALRAAS